MSWNSWPAASRKPRFFKIPPWTPDILRRHEALQHRRAAADLDAANPLAHSQLGGIYLRQQMLSQAQAEFEAVLRANPQDNEAQGSLGYICLQQRRYGQAEAYFEKALEINPEDPVAQANLKALRNARPGRP